MAGLSPFGELALEEKAFVIEHIASRIMVVGMLLAVPGCVDPDPLDSGMSTRSGGSGAGGEASSGDSGRLLLDAGSEIPPDVMNLQVPDAAFARDVEIDAAPVR